MAEDIRGALETFLLDSGLAEKVAGYGHASAEEVADELLRHFNITIREN